MNFSFPQTVENSVESLCRGVKKSEGAEKQNSIFKKEALTIIEPFESLCSSEIYADFRANFFADKAKICRHTFVWQEFLTQYATKFAEKT